MPIDKRIWWGLAIALAIPVTYGTVKLVSYLSETEEKRINAMFPSASQALRRLIDSLNSEGIRTFVGNTFRSTEESQRYVLEGKASAGLKHDWHTIGRAVDLYIYDAVAKKVDFTGQKLDQIRRMHEVAKQQGWTSIAFNPDGSKHYLKGAKGPVWDAGHLQWQEGMNFDNAATYNAGVNAANVVMGAFGWGQG